MDNENVQAALDDLKVRQDLFLISKLENEYNELSDKCNKLYTYIYSLDFITKVPSCDERCLMQEQHKRMESYRTNLYQRIDFYRCRVKIACGYDILISWSVVAERIRQFGVPLPQQKIERTIETPCGPVHLVNLDEQHHCGRDADLDDACCQARETCPVGDGTAVVKGQIGYDTRLLGMQVVGIGDMRCDGCPSEQYGERCVKLELVDGGYICLAPIHNSIVTE